MSSWTGDRASPADPLGRAVVWKDLRISFLSVMDEGFVDLQPCECSIRPLTTTLRLGFPTSESMASTVSKDSFRKSNSLFRSDLFFNIVST
jgi:hypothetical protein